MVKQMEGSKGQRNRGPDEKLASQRAAKRAMKLDSAKVAEEVEGNFRKTGGYGKAVVSIWAEPPGGVENSPAYLKVKWRCGGVMPPPAKRVGAPLKGGFPLNKYPPNVLVDGQRGFWVPDDWAQCIKNTGPGGTYVGWMSPEGKFFYHRRGFPHAMEETLGRTLTCIDGINTIRRHVRSYVSPAADKKFLAGCLTAAERKHVLPESGFHFAVVSARRATLEDGQQDIMVVEAQFQVAGVKPTWYVDAESLGDYQRLGLHAVVGGKLTPARNMALDHASKNGLVCVQVSDDISKWNYYDISKQSYRGETNMRKANEAVKGTHVHIVSPLAMAQFMLAKMRSSSMSPKPQLAGVFPTGNPSMALGTQEFAHYNFILGDFFVVDKSPVRFDETMTLKEDYDFSCGHIAEHGSVLRCNRVLLSVKHSTNGGGAVSTRDTSGSKERQNIDILMKKWPGVFKPNIRRKDEVLMRWKDPSSKRAQEDGPQRKTPSRASPQSPSTPGAALNSKRSPEFADGSESKRQRAGAPAEPIKEKRETKNAEPEFNPEATVRITEGGSSSGKTFIKRRVELMNGKTVSECLQMEYVWRDGSNVRYEVKDLRYDLKMNRLVLEDP